MGEIVNQAILTHNYLRRMTPLVSRNMTITMANIPCMPLKIKKTAEAVFLLPKKVRAEKQAHAYF
jgi:hypothetical protein